MFFSRIPHPESPTSMPNTLLHELWQLLIFWIHMSKPDEVYFQEERIRFGSHSRQYMIRIGPEEPVEDKVIFFNHGGGWQFGRPEWFRKYAYVLAREGYQVFLPSHRKVPFFNSIQIRQDMQLALKGVMDWMDRRGGTENRVVIGGMSSGGNLAALLSLDPENRQSAGVKLEQIAGMFLFAAPLNLDAMWHSPSLLAFAGSRKRERYQKANPINFLDNTPPHLP